MIGARHAISGCCFVRSIGTIVIGRFRVRCDQHDESRNHDQHRDKEFLLGIRKRHCSTFKRGGSRRCDSASNFDPRQNLNNPFAQQIDFWKTGGVTIGRRFKGRRRRPSVPRSGWIYNDFATTRARRSGFPLRADLSTWEGSHRPKITLFPRIFSK
jgi:hypothetical protein